MPRATQSVPSRTRRKRQIKLAKGRFGNASRLARYAKQSNDRAGQFAYRDRRKKKTTWRQLWIVRINAACRAQEITYSRFMNGIKKAGIVLDRKALSQLAIEDEDAFTALVTKAKEALS